jgi:hypothetical protein
LKDAYLAHIESSFFRVQLARVWRLLELKQHDTVRVEDGKPNVVKTNCLITRAQVFAAKPRNDKGVPQKKPRIRIRLEHKLQLQEKAVSEPIQFFANALVHAKPLSPASTCLYRFILDTESSAANVLLVRLVVPQPPLLQRGAELVLPTLQSADCTDFPSSVGKPGIAPEPLHAIVAR